MYRKQSWMCLITNDEKTAKKLWHLRGEVETCQGIYTNKLLAITIYSIKREKEGIAVSLMSFYKNMLTTVIDATYKYDFNEENSFLPESIKDKSASLVELVVSFEIFRNMHWLKPNILHAKNRSRTKPSIVSIRTNLLSR
ncbi:hypothetical protein Q0590_32615 [Rhodocytophaga aerolata]|uniref:Uncharacterized protein n=1 Tax=Rhodocytophaga aerolata TaxID=455078 RepID=A0ABT8RIR4_9BACT|nr:hypothetical protein [Rhodocytophaga aerolata]MDO1451063.1 hypothetical protein [Rhodocytophaga aerolata]